jgi:hypothetical protein
MASFSRRPFTRRTFMGGTLAAATVAAGRFILGNPWRSAGAVGQAGTPPESGDPKPLRAMETLADAMRSFPLLAIGDAHQLQEEHDFLQSLLHQPELPRMIDDIVVEFGNSFYQDVADRFIGGESVADAELRPLWRYAPGGLGGVWDPPVYEQFFRTVRAVNWMRPKEQRLRVLLGDPPIDFSSIRGATALAAYAAANPIVLQRDAFYARVVEQEVLDRGRHALLIAGSRHLRRGVMADNGISPNAGSLIATYRPGALFVVDVLIRPPDEAQDRMSLLTASWPRPSIALLAGTWLGGQENRADPLVDDGAASYGAQADAVLFLGTAEQLTASRAEPAIYQAGEYHDELGRIAGMLAEAGLSNNDDPAHALQIAERGPRYFDQ